MWTKLFRSKACDQSEINHLKSLFETSAQFFCVMDRDLRYLFTNPAHVKLCNGVDLTGKTAYDNHPNTQFIDMIKKVMNSGEPIILTEIKNNMNATVRYVDLTYAPRFCSKGKINGVYGLGLDVTDRVLARMALEKNEAQLKLITNMLPAFVSYTDEQGRYQFLNKKYEEWFEKPLTEMIGKTRAEITPPEYAIQSRPNVLGAIKGKSSHSEGILFKKNGQFLNLDIDYIADIDPETKKPRGMVAVGVDITERVAAMKEVELAKKELDEVFKQAPLPMCLLMGEDFEFTMANPLYVKFVDREVLGKTVKQAFEGIEISLYLETLKKIYDSGEALTLIEAPVEMKNKEGVLTKRFINAGYTAFLGIDGKSKGVLVTMQDVTTQVNEREKIEKMANDLQQAVNSRDNFLAVASHELKTPLTSLKLQMQTKDKVLAKNGMASFDEKSLKKFIDTSILQVNRLTRLVDDMLDISRITAQTLEMNFEQSDFSQLVESVFEEHHAEFENLGMKVSVEIEKNLVVKLDPIRMGQVLTNLITNSMKYASQAPLSVNVSKEQGQVVLKIKDHGIGIDPQFHETIFKRFERATTNSELTGMGLGLYISQQIVEAHGGKISVVSSVGEGATFVVKLTC